MRIPRKKKKAFKNLMFGYKGHKMFIQKDSITKDGCVCYPKKNFLCFEYRNK